jgi:hypothetical protein
VVLPIPDIPVNKRTLALSSRLWKSLVPPSDTFAACGLRRNAPRKRRECLARIRHWTLDLDQCSAPQAKTAVNKELHSSPRAFEGEAGTWRGIESSWRLRRRTTRRPRSAAARRVRALIGTHRGKDASPARPGASLSRPSSPERMRRSPFGTGPAKYFKRAGYRMLSLCAAIPRRGKLFRSHSRCHRPCNLMLRRHCGGC